MGIKWVWTIPNVLSLFRIALIPVFAVLYLMSAQQPELLYWAAGVLIVSGLTDCCDGYVARRFHQISDIGKLLDPVADKLTQVTVVVCLAVRLPRLWPLVIICLSKEMLQMIGGLLLLRRGAKVQPARWYGKVCTFVFYFVMALVVVFPLEPAKPLLFDWNMPMWLFGTLIFLVTACMLFAFYRYFVLYHTVSTETKQQAAETEQTAASPQKEDLVP